MRVISAATVAPLLLSAVAAWTPASTAQTDALASQGLIKLAEYEAQHFDIPPTCNTSTAYIRREWDSFTAQQKLEYISAVLCLQSLPSKSGSFAPGARSRYDDFVAVHINQTLTIHATVRATPTTSRLHSSLPC